MRLDRVLAHAGWGTRSEMREAVRTGRVTVDRDVVRRPEAHVEPDRRRILLDGEDIDWREHYYLMMNKPAGYVSATVDPREKTVTDLLTGRYGRMGLFPAGRLDKDSTGLLILTDDGAFAHGILSPGRHVPKRYRVETDGELADFMVKRFRDGLKLEDGTACRPAELKILDKKSAEIVLHEGKYHQIKRMMEVFSLKVTRLHRVSIGGLKLPETLAPGGFERIAEDTLSGLFGKRNAQTESGRFVE